MAVADFGGSVYVFSADQISGHPTPLFTVFIGVPVRTLTWCKLTNNIVIGCVGGGLFLWKYGAEEAILIVQYHHTINILRAVDSKVYAGTSDGEIKIFDS